MYTQIRQQYLHPLVNPKEDKDHHRLAEHLVLSAGQKNEDYTEVIVNAPPMTPLMKEKKLKVGAWCTF